MAKLSFVRDLQFAQEYNYPTLEINIDRERAGQFGLTMSDVVRSVVPATSSSRFTEPNYWRDPNSGNAFQIQVELPQNQIQSVDAIGRLPVMPTGRPELQLDNMASLKLGTMPGLIERFNGQHIISVTANIHGITLGEAALKLKQALAGAGAPPRGAKIVMKGEIPPLEQTISGLRAGLLLAVAAIFLLLSANFQSMRLALTSIATVPAVIAGATVMLWATGTTLNIQSFVGLIMAIGVATANAILLTNFAETFRREGHPAGVAAVEAAQRRLRPLIMTSFAMIAGMMPMALGLGEGGEQTAPLGRAVVGGLIASMMAKLLVLPSVFAVVMGGSSIASVSLDPDDPTSQYHADAIV